MTNKSFGTVNEEAPKAVCPLCNGEGLTYVLSKESTPARQPGRMLKTMMTIPCLCRLNQRVEDRYPCFLSVPDIEEAFINATLKNWDLGKSYALTGNPPRFFKIIKALFVLLSRKSNARFHICNGLELVKEYYLDNGDEKSDKAFFSLARDVHLLVLRFESRSTNKAMAPAVYDVVRARLSNNLPTWIWSEGSLDATQEYSADLQSLMSDDKFVRKSLVVAKAATDYNAMLKGGAHDA